MAKRKIKIFPIFFVIILTAGILILFSFFNGGNNLKVHFINVGYGDSILIEFPDHRTMLIDAGLKEYSSKVVDYIKEVGVGKIDSIILTHPHSDH